MYCIWSYFMGRWAGTMFRDYDDARTPAMWTAAPRYLFRTQFVVLPNTRRPPLLADGDCDGRSQGARPSEPLRTNTRATVHALSEMSDGCVPIMYSSHNKSLTVENAAVFRFPQGGDGRHMRHWRVTSIHRFSQNRRGYLPASTKDVAKDGAQRQASQPSQH